MIQTQSIRIVAAVLVLMFSAIHMGCAAHSTMQGKWLNSKIVADGIDSEWQVSPQYYDKERRLTIRLANDQTHLYLCVSTGSRDLIRQLSMSGLSLWIDPNGNEEKVFGIHLSGATSDKSHQARPPIKMQKDSEALTNFKPDPSNNKSVSSHIEELRQVAITYSDTTGPLTMNMSEVRQSGIDIGVGQPEGQRLVYEFIIAFSSAPSLTGLAPEMMVGVTINSGALNAGDQENDSMSGPMGQGGPGGDMGDASGSKGGGPNFGGGMGNGPGGPPLSGGKNNKFEVWLPTRLAKGYEK